MGRMLPVILALRPMGLRPDIIDGRRGLASGLAPIVCAERVRNRRSPLALALPASSAARCARIAIAKASASSLALAPAREATDCDDTLTTGVVEDAEAADETPDCADMLPWLTTLLLLLPAGDRNGLVHIRVADAGAEADFVKGAWEVCVELGAEADDVVAMGDRIGVAALMLGLDCRCVLAPDIDEATEAPDGMDGEGMKN